MRQQGTRIFLKVRRLHVDSTCSCSMKCAWSMPCVRRVAQYYSQCWGG